MRPRKRPRVDLSDDCDQSDRISTDNTESDEAAQSAESRKNNADTAFNVPERVGVFAVGRKDRIERKTKHQNSEETSRLHSFRSFGIAPALLAVLSGMSITAPTEIQTACIPQILAGEYNNSTVSCELKSTQGRDCIGNAKTGSGKTIAFALPISQKLSLDPCGLYALVLTPTRELAFQIYDQFAVLGAPLNIKTAVIVGGMDMIAQALELENRPHVIVATPGRLVDHLRSGSDEWNLSRIKFLVLDEADRLLTASFAPELEFLFGVLPTERQTCLFTATLTPAVESLANAPPKPGRQIPFIHRIVSATETVEALRQFYILVPSHVREAYLFYLLCNPPESTIALRRNLPEPASRRRGNGTDKANRKSSNSEDDLPLQPPPTIIFCARTRTAAYLTTVLKTLSIRSTALHSRLTQRERLTSLSLFRSFVVPVLVSTDVGARGLDIEDVAMVVNWDLPNEPEEYTHRVGRTARAGKGGVAISFVTERDEDRVLNVEERINTKLEEMTLPEERVLEKLNAVSTAKRLANMELHDTGFGNREEVQKAKRRRRPPTS